MKPGMLLLLAASLFIGGVHAADWPRLLGPADNATSPETKLLRELPKDGPRVLWQVEKGSGFGGPAIVGGRCVIFHRVDGREVVRCLDAESGKGIWKYDYEAQYRPRYGGSEGPRTSPVIADGRVFTFGITAQLTALDLATGKVLWQRDCARDFAMGKAFFGYGSTPLVLGQRLIVQVGGKVDGASANTVALDVATGKTLWAAKHEWGASYASPVPAKIHGRDGVLVFAGGESRPPTGGLIVMDAADGKVLSAFPHRASVAESVNASSPVVSGARVFVSEAYTAGGVCVEIAPDFSAKPAWSAENTGIYWMTPLVLDGHLYASAGQSERLAEFVCHEIATGKEKWRTDLGGDFGRASLLHTGAGVLCLGEFGDLAWLDLSPAGAKIRSRCRLFHAPETWTLPALANGRLYVSQNDRGDGGTKPRLICYDLRGE